jgi:hypothetical protein
MGDRLENPYWVRTSEDKVRRKSLCGSKGSLCPRKATDISGPGLVEAGRYRMVSELTLTVSRARVSQLRRHGVHG